MTETKKMTLDEYLVQLKGTQAKLTEQEEYEVCAEITELIEAIETKNLKKFMQLNFDIAGMKKVGFFEKKSTYEQMAERVVHHFSLNNIFDYAIREGMWCRFERYAKGLYDIKKKVEF